jgi:hypothetical protein
MGETCANMNAELIIIIIVITYFGLYVMQSSGVLLICNYGPPSESPWHPPGEGCLSNNNKHPYNYSH